MRKLATIILAAGQGTRMKSPLPKVLHPVAGEPMISRIIRVVKKCKSNEIRVVVGVGKELIEPIVVQNGAIPFVQKEQRGTGHAVICADYETLDGDVLIVNGDHPLIQEQEILSSIEEFKNGGADIALLSCELDNPDQYGRVVRHKGTVQAIVEAKDASAETLKIKEINTGIYIVKSEILKKFLPQLTSHNAQKEIYLTDIVGLAVENKLKVEAIKVSLHCAMGVNDQGQLAKATQVIVQRKIQKLMSEGVVFLNPRTVYIEDDVQIGAATVIYPGVFIKGQTQIGSYCVLEPQVFILNSKIADSVQVKAGSYIESSEIKSKAVIGPYAHLRPETVIGSEARVGNFVEMKNVKFGDRAKASHLTYLGDAIVGEDTNIGCGTITCNYEVDKKKYETKIGKNVFVGSDVQFIAPVEIGDNAVIASGSTITEPVSNDGFAIARSRQTTKPNYTKKWRPT